ncbi:FtsX-like permease family protein [Streptomyces sp. SID335]|nr:MULTISPECIES: ABC transporter permease [unclassified Streptomyces]MYY80644.1 FtsX-like permease family protein [Streptomyces sp. SID335]NDZ87957.1 FtsX-like permease family protein [Streptomyces sp. SID10115]NEB43940.1 FtsX-like permease family protein [Streptomyces sp. SID339]
MAYVPNGLARAAVRFKPAAFAGTFVALMMASLIVAACGILLETGLRASVPSERYAGAPVVAASKQSVHFVAGSGDSKSESDVPLPDQARVDNSLVAKAGSVPGARTAVPDVTFPVKSGDKDVTAHGWGSTSFTGEKLTAGRAPHPGEVVLAAPGASVGDRTTLTTADGPRTFRVSGTVRAGETAPTAWFADSEAVRVSGHPGRVDAIAVLPEKGVPADTLKSRVAYALGDKAEVHTGDDRSEAEGSSLAYAKEMLTGLGGSFGGIAALTAVFTAAGTVALSVGQRAREYALLRAIGTTPRQIRRTIATETLLVAPAAALVGLLPGLALAHWWFGQLKEKGAIPEAVDLSVSFIPLVAAVGVAVLTALGAGYLAARRPSRIKPGQALSEANVERVPFGWIRTPLGIAAAVGGVIFAGFAANNTGDDAANAALGIVMLFMLAVALLGPLVARGCAALFGLPLRGAGASASLAAANSRTNARRLASAITPIVLAMAFSSVLVFMHTSEERVAADQQRAGITADHIITSDGGLAPATLAKAADAKGVTSAVGLLKSSVLVPVGSGAERYLATASTQGIDGTAAGLAKVQDLKVETGTLKLGSGQIAVDATLAESAHVKTGDRLGIRLPDGTKASPTVVATYGRGLGLSQVTMPAADLKQHVTSAFTTEIWTTGGSAQALSGLGALKDRDGYATARSMDNELNAWANTTMAAVLGGFAAIAAINTLVMTVLDRRRELGTLRLIGSTRRQVLRMIRWEALLVACAGIVIGSAIAFATLVPMMKGLTGESPYVPPLVYGSFVGAVLVMGLASATIPARAALRSAA